MQTYRYGLVWRIAALLPLLLAIGVPLLMVANQNGARHVALDGRSEALEKRMNPLV